MADAGKQQDGVSFLFYIFLAYLVFLFLRPMELYAPWLAAFRPMAILWVIAFLGSMAHVLQHKDPAATAKHYWILMGLWIAVPLSLLRQGMFGDALWAFTDFSASVLLFVLISFNLRTMQRLRLACYVILACLFTLSLTGIYSYYTGYKVELLVLPQIKNFMIDLPEELPSIPALDDSDAYMWRVRAVGFLSDPNDFAQALIVALPMLWWFVRKGAWFHNLMFVGVPAAVMLYCVVLTNSRGAILGVASLLFLGVRNVLGNFKTMVLLGIAGAGALVVGMTGGRAMSTKEKSAGERIEAWYDGFQMLKSSPVFGVGYGQFTDHHYLTAHNSFVLGFAELGFFGYFFWIALLVLGFTTVGRVASHAPPGSEERLVGNILRSSLVGYITCAWFLSRTYQPVLYALLALCTAVWVCARKSPSCANIAPLQAPLNIFKSTCLAVAGSMAAVYAFIFISNLGG